MLLRIMINEVEVRPRDGSGAFCARGANEVRDPRETGKHRGQTRHTHLKNSLEGRRLVVREWWRRVGVWYACEADLPRENALDERRLCLRLMHEGHRLG